jgi:L-lactate dehydrogenase
VVLHDRSLERAEGAIWDIADGSPFLYNVDLQATDDWRELTGVEVVVVTVGRLASAGKSRRDERNGRLMRSVMARLDEIAPGAAVVIVSNPVDVMTRIAHEASSRPWQMIFGTGTVLDTARLRLAVARRLGVDPQNTHVQMLGEHGEGCFPAWSTATIGPVPLDSFPLPAGTILATLKAQSADWARRRGADVYARRGYTANGIAVAVSRIVECVLRDQRRILTLSTRAPADYGLHTGSVLSLPCVLGRAGVIRQLPLALDPEERQMLDRTASVLEAEYCKQGRSDDAGGTVRA